MDDFNPKSSLQKELLHKDLARQDIGGEAYQNAMNAGKHSTWAKQYLDKPIVELERGIKSLDNQIKLHRDKIQNPEKYYPGFKNLDKRNQENLINLKWDKDISKQIEQKSILEGILRNRLNDEK